MERTKIFALSANTELAEKVCKYLGVELGKSEVQHFADGETCVKFYDVVRGDKVFLIQSTCNPVNERVMELLIALDALKRSSAGEITCVIPYFGYARQDRKVGPRQPITAKLIADLLQAAGADRVVALDLHNESIQGFFNIPVDALTVGPLIAQRISQYGIKDLTVVSPDHGGVKRARDIGAKLACPIAVIDKRRQEANQCEAMFILGDVKDRNVVIVDDICDTCGTLIAAADILKKNGAKDVYVAISHGVLSGDAVERVEKSVIKKLIITDTIPLKKQSEKIEVVTVTPMLAEIIKAISEETSVGHVYDMFM